MATQEELLQQTEAFRDEAEGFAQSASTDKTLAQAARSDAQLANTNAQNAASASAQSAVDSTYQKDLTIEARDTTVSARNEVISARNVVLTKADEVATNATNALAASSQASSHVIKASQWADYPRDQIVPGESSYSARHWAEAAAEAASGITGDIIFLGPWDAAVDGTPPTPSQSVRYLIVSDGIVDGKQVFDGDYIIYDVASSGWLVTSNANRIASVNGYESGNVVLDFGDFAGAVDGVFETSVGLRGKKASDGNSHHLIRSIGDKAAVGALGFDGLQLNSGTVPQWYDGTNYLNILHTGGGQTVAGMDFSSAVTFKSGTQDIGLGGPANTSIADYNAYDLKIHNADTATLYVDLDILTEGFQLRGHNTAATFRNLFEVHADGTAWLDSGTKEIIHTGGGQTISGTTVLDGHVHIKNHVAGVGNVPLLISHAADDPNNTPVMIVAGDGEAEDVLAEFRANGTGTAVDLSLAANSSHAKVQIMGDGKVKAVDFVEGGTSLSAKYLGITATAANSDKFGDLSLDKFIFGEGSMGTSSIAAGEYLDPNDGVTDIGWDGIRKSGFYDGNGQQNAPSASGWYWGIHASHANGNGYGWTMVASNSQNPDWYLRGVNANNWGSWHRLLHEDINPTLTGSWAFENNINFLVGKGISSKDMNDISYEILAIGEASNNVDVGDQALQLSLHSSATPKWYDGTTVRNILHSGGGQTVGGWMTFEGGSIGLSFNETDAPTDEKKWNFNTSNGNFVIQGISDSGSGGGGYMSFGRTGNNITDMKGYRAGAETIKLDFWNSQILVDGKKVLTEDGTVVGDQFAQSPIWFDSPDQKEVGIFSKTFDVTSYLSAGEWMEIARLLPTGNSRNYWLSGELFYGASAESSCIRFIWSVRSNTMPSTSVRLDSWRITENHTGVKLAIWKDDITGESRLMIKKESGGDVHNLSCNLFIHQRGSYDNYDFSQRGEFTAIEAGFTETVYTPKEYMTLSGGQTVAGTITANGGFWAPNNQGLVGHTTGGTSYNIARIDSSNLLQLGNTSFTAHIHSSGVPKWYNGSANVDLIHANGNQTINGLLGLNVTGSAPFDIEKTTTGYFDFTMRNTFDNYGVSMRVRNSGNFGLFHNNGTFTEGDSILESTPGGATNIYHADGLRIATDSLGINVTGQIDVTGGINSDENIQINSTAPALIFHDTDQADATDLSRLVHSGAFFYIQSEGSIRFTGYNGADLTAVPTVRLATADLDLLHSGGGQTVGGTMTMTQLTLTEEGTSIALPNDFQIDSALGNMRMKAGGTTKFQIDSDGTVLVQGGVFKLLANQYNGFAGTYAMDARNSDIVGLNGLYFNDTSGSINEGIAFPRDGTATGVIGDFSYLRAYQDILRFSPDGSADYIVLHQGNVKAGDTPGYAIQQLDANVMFGSAAKFFTNDGGGNIGIRFGGSWDDQLAGEDGCAWELEAANDSATGNFTINRAPNIAAAGDAMSFSTVLTLAGSDGRVTFAGEFTVNSDERLKDNVRYDWDMAELRDKLMQIDWCYYDWLDRSKGKNIFGVIAQRFKAVFPELVYQDEKTGMYDVDYIGILKRWAAVSAWQEERLQRVEAALGVA